MLVKCKDRMNKREFYEHCKVIFELDSDRAIESILYGTTVNVSRNKFDIGTFDPDIWVKVGDEFVKHGR